MTDQILDFYGGIWEISIKRHSRLSPCLRRLVISSKMGSPYYYITWKREGGRFLETGLGWIDLTFLVRSEF